jgi:hypothetical protein
MSKLQGTSCQATIGVSLRDGLADGWQRHRTQVRLKSLLYLVAHARIRFDPRTSFGQEYRLRLKRPPPNASRRCPPFKSSTRSALLLCGLFPWVALLRLAFGQKIWHTIFFSSKANFQMFLKLFPSLAELLHFRKTRAVWFFRVVWRRTPHVACRQRVRRPCSDSSLWFAQRFVSRFLSGTTAIPSAASG